ncbi:hypothetical protein Q428_12195 [Fervidicella metallireducens AeB]|uniref:EamA domain-containing protein n=1 Tax=Fervidicella metallireducens AeB TaxID=1403537 RepID=A0A017RSL1_9CLOT|nr:hypothetical protein [Fervidicella metallireducens]EYE87627.1 hypothetical protein Q428_12195 [Fervidicella metallireducens AeB]
MRFKGELFVILSAIGFALMPVFAKFSYAAVPVLQLFFRLDFILL